MHTQGIGVRCLIASAVLALGISSAGRAQDTVKKKVPAPVPVGPGFHFAGELGARDFTKELDARDIGKFQEYRDFRAGQQASPVVRQLLLQYTPADTFGFYSITARKLFERDQSVWLLAKRPGNYDFQIRWDRIPHLYSTTARSPGVEDNPGFNTLPTPRPDSIAWRNAPYIGDVRQQWDPVRVSFGYTPTPAFDFKTDYTRIAKSGGIPASMSFSGSSGPQREFVSPIDQTMNDFRISQSYASDSGRMLPFIKSWQMVASYAYSRFQNGIKSTLVDNPQISQNTFAGGAATSLLSLAPDNSAHTGSVVAAVSFPMRTRLTGALTTSWAYQNDAFFAQTNNDSLARDPNFALTALPRTSLNGETRRTTVNLTATARPISKLALAGRFRTFDYSQQTPAFKIKALIVSDRTVTPSDSAAFIPLPYKKTNSDWSATYELARALTLTGGYATEEWKRNDQAGAGLPYDNNLAVRDDVSTTNEKTPRVSLDYNGLSWLSLRASYLGGRRRGSGKYTESSTELIGFRRFDLADRDRHRVNVMATLMPIDPVTVELTYQLGNDAYPHSQYGDQTDKMTMKGIDLDLTPVDGYSASVGYTHEYFDNNIVSRFRTGAAGSPTFDNPTYRWTNTNQDRNDTFYFNGVAAVIPDKLDLIGNVSLSDGSYHVLNSNPQTPTGGTAAQNLNATAEDWPLIKSRLLPIMLALRYRYSADWAMTFSYQYETYDQTDFRFVAPIFTSNGLASGTPITSFTGDLPGTIGQIAGSNTGQYHFLGNNYHPYNTGWITLLISYHPSLLPFAKGRTTF